MIFRFYHHATSSASRAVGLGTLTVGLLLIGFGMLILALPEVFAMLAAIVFFLLGGTFAVTAIKIFWVQYKMDKFHKQQGGGYRDNVRIRDFDG